MHRFIRSFSIVIVSGVLAASVVPQNVASAEIQPILQLAPEQLKTDAFAALRRGEYDHSSELLRQSAAGSHDVTTELMASWVSSFTAQYELTLVGRKAEHDKAVAQILLLSANQKPDYALDSLARAHSLALDKKAFRAEPWVSEMVLARAAEADAFEKSGEFYKAVRIYVTLGAIDQADPMWKAKLKQAARYVRIQALYTPKYFRSIQQAKQTEDEQVDAILEKAGLTRTTATTKPTTKRSTDDDASIDWREVLKGIEYDMVAESLRDAVKNYYRSIDYRLVASGGVQSLRTLAQTPHIETQFVALGDPERRDRFLAGLLAASVKIEGSGPDMDYSAFKSVLNSIRDANSQSVNLPESVFVYEFMDGALAELDQFSSMIWPQQIEEFQSSTEGEFSGVGIQIERAETGDLKVISPIEDTPAYRAGIKAGSSITHINGELAKGMMLDQAVKRIKGPTGTKVTLTVRSPDGNVKDYPLRRDTVKVASIKGWKRLPGGTWDWMIDPVQRIGYVRLSTFSKTSADDLKAALEQMEKSGARGMVLDLRSDPGGLLNIAIDVADMFIPKGNIVSTHADREGGHSPSVADADPKSTKYTLPVVVLVNQFSASASEIVSGALKDQHRAIIVGERSYGKGSVQMLFPLSARTAALKLTTSRYYLPSGRCLHREETSTEWGVDPDFTIEMTPEQMIKAMEARSQMDVVWIPGQDAPVPTTQPANLLDVDPQLSAAVMLMRLQVAGVKLVEVAAK